MYLVGTVVFRNTNNFGTGIVGKTSNAKKIKSVFLDRIHGILYTTGSSYTEAKREGVYSFFAKSPHRETLATQNEPKNTINTQMTIEIPNPTPAQSITKLSRATKLNSRCQYNAAAVDLPSFFYYKNTRPLPSLVNTMATLNPSNISTTTTTMIPTTTAGNNNNVHHLPSIVGKLYFVQYVAMRVCG